MHPEKPSTLLFDLGGVLYLIDDRRTLDAFARLGFKDFGDIYNLKAQVQMVDRVEKGFIAGNEFLDWVLEVAPVPTTRRHVLDAWNAMLLGFPKENIALLRQLTRRYRLLLLSNTNQLHMDYINSQLQRENGIGHISQLFGTAYLSYEMGLRKPEPEIFRHVLEEQKLDPAEVVYFEDNTDNCAAAQALGIATYVYPRNHSLQQFLANETKLLV